MNLMKIAVFALPIAAFAGGATYGTIQHTAKGVDEQGHDVADEHSDAHEGASKEHEAPSDKHSDDAHTATDDSHAAYLKLEDPFVVPVISEGEVVAMVVMTMSLQTTEEEKTHLLKIEPKLRDAFLGVLFDHANMGYFDGNFIETSRVTDLRRALFEVADNLTHGKVHDLLISDLLRQAV